MGLPKGRVLLLQFLFSKTGKGVPMEPNMIVLRRMGLPPRPSPGVTSRGVLQGKRSDTMTALAEVAAAL